MRKDDTHGDYSHNRKDTKGERERDEGGREGGDEKVGGRETNRNERSPMGRGIAKKMSEKRCTYGRGG